MYYFLSALCYFLPFYHPALWPLLWFFLPLLYTALFHKRSLLILATWAFIVSFFHALPLCRALFAMAAGPFWITIIPPLALLGYTAIHFFILLLFAAYLVKKNRYPTAILYWTLLIWLYFFYYDTAILWPFGRHEGYPFINPLLPMAYAPRMLAPLYHLPLPIVLLWFCAITSTITLIFHTSSRTSLILFVALATPWFFMAWQLPQRTTPHWLANIGHLPLSLPSSLSRQSAELLIANELDALFENHPTLTTIILPESSWNNADLTCASHLDPFMKHPIKNLLIGSFAQERGHCFNSLYRYREGIQMQRYDKRQAVPLVERVTLHANTLCTQLFFQKSPPIYPSSSSRIPFLLPEIGSFTPYICSELYCNNNPDGPHNHPILATSNDTWFMPHFQKLMALAARFRALQWQQPILYIGYHYAHYFDQYGQSNPIATTAPSRMIQ